MLTSHTDRKYTIEEYRPEWKTTFDTEADRIRRVFGDDIIAIEHVGSTSVPGMAGKPCIDMDVVIKDISRIAAHEQQLEKLGYEALGELVAKNAFFFGKEKNNARIFNLDVMEVSHSELKKTVAVRDYLRAHPDEVKGYSDLKRALFDEYANDYGSYRRRKDIYMKSLEKKAHSWAGVVS